MERSLRNAGAEDAEVAGEEATEGAEDAEVAGEEATEELRCWNVAKERWGCGCGNSRGGGYGGGALLERSLRNAGAEDAEIAGEEATEELRSQSFQ